MPKFAAVARVQLYTPHTCGLYGGLSNGIYISKEEIDKAI